MLTHAHTHTHTHTLTHTHTHSHTEPEIVEANVFENMKITEPFHEIEGKLTWKLEELKLNRTDKSSEKPNSLSVSVKLPKTEMSVFSGDPLK